MTENCANTTLSYAERQAQLALLPACVQEALQASASAAEQAVHTVRIQHSEVHALLGVILQSKLGAAAVGDIDLAAVLSALTRLLPGDGDDASLENIGASTIEAALPALLRGQAQGLLR